MKQRAKVVDLFAGGGGVSAGIRGATGRSPDIAVNHWPVAIAVHEANHPETKHYTANIYKVKPEKVTDGCGVSFLWASPDCTNYSVARGGVPVQQKIRLLPFSVISWAAKVKPGLIIVENVQEFRKWGPLLKGADGKLRPDPERLGETFRFWVRKLQRLGYEVEHRVLTACDFGAPTRRKRLFVVARCDGQPISWPERTHASPEECALNPRLKPFHTAAECIDWSLDGQSIFERKKPLAPKTMERIFKGLKRFVLENPRPFIVGVGGRMGQTNAAGVDEPINTVTGKNDRGVVVPVITKFQQNSIGQDAEQPLDTVLAGATRFGLLAPHLIKVNHGGNDARGEQLGLPLTTVTAARRGHALVAPNLIAIDQQSTGDTASSATDPLHTVVTKNRSGLVAAWLQKHYGGVVGKPLGVDPLDTITAQDHHSVAAAALVKLRGQCSGTDPAEPMPTITASGTHVAEVRAFLTLYYGQDGSAGQTLAEPMRTITAKARLGIVTVYGVDYQIVDIRFRMLRSHELLKATCGKYAEGYDLSAAKTEEAKVRCIGNMVPPELVEALVRANVKRSSRTKRAVA